MSGGLLEKVGISPRPSGGGATDSRNSVGEGSSREGGSRAVGAGAGALSGGAGAGRGPPALTPLWPPPSDVSPVVAGLVGASVLVVCVSVTVFVWTCCHQQAEKKHKTPPYKFIHMLKGVSIYPEALSSGKKIIKVQRDKDGPGRGGGRGNSQAGAAEAGLLGRDRGPAAPGSGSCMDQLPIRADDGEEPRSPVPSLTPGESKTTSPSSPEEDVTLGSLTFSVDYNFPKKALVVTIQEAHGLPVMDDQTQGSDPYIKMTILPDKRHRVKTRVLRKTLDPVFDETFTFYGVPYSQLQDLVLHFLVLSFDRFSRDDVIGEVMVPLAGVDPSTGKVQLTRDIVKRNIQVRGRACWGGTRVGADEISGGTGDGVGGHAGPWEGSAQFLRLSRGRSKTEGQAVTAPVGRCRSRDSCLRHVTWRPASRCRPDAQA